MFELMKQADGLENSQAASSQKDPTSTVQGWQWVDISNGISWSDFPPAALEQDLDNNCLLWMKYEGQEYRVDQNGGWLLIESRTDSPFLNPSKNLAVSDPDYSEHFDGCITSRRDHTSTVFRLALRRREFYHGFCFIERKRGIMVSAYIP